MLAIIVATLSGMALGALWYSPLLFGKSWLTALGKSQAELPSQTLPMIGSVAACLISAVALYLLLAATGADTVGKALGISLVVGFGLVFTAMWSDNLFCGWGRQLLLIQAGYRVTYLALMAIILAVLG